MTEAVQAMCKWALEQENVSCIIAETDIDGFASQRILQRCGFDEKRREESYSNGRVCLNVVSCYKMSTQDKT